MKNTLDFSMETFFRKIQFYSRKMILIETRNKMRYIGSFINFDFRLNIIFKTTVIYRFNKKKTLIKNQKNVSVFFLFFIIFFLKKKNNVIERI
ncbi:hypothetical protein CMESO_298 (nucleomorph) [Chroomonas mesostigmatica CCMP1168]|uniref:Sm domain-containing protein n=1 Tax=Chroomonas mesostigmatica CCMP1168 TaxID=1195612 RepID=J7G853_9CRYP|nr:hypothetical protein CMESO_298 [Chroomonas mesostigmatica CCMP1168]